MTAASRRNARCLPVLFGPQEEREVGGAALHQEVHVAAALVDLPMRTGSHHKWGGVVRGGVRVRGRDRGD